MAPSGLNRLLVVSLAIISGIGAIDAAIGGHGDLFIVLVISAVLSLTLLGRLESSRPAVPIRRDLVVWLRNRAAMSGESIGAVTDRALAAYRERYGHSPSQSGPER